MRENNYTDDDDDDPSLLLVRFLRRIFEHPDFHLESVEQHNVIRMS